MANGEYESMAKTTLIRATSRASVCIRNQFGKDNYYTLEYSEERAIPDVEGVDLEAERAFLWETANGEVDRQIEDLLAGLNENR